MLKHFPAILVALIVTNVCLSQGVIKRLNGEKVGIENMNKTLNQLLINYNIPGASICIINNNEVVYANNLGYACADNLKSNDSTVFRAASITKAVFASAVVASFMHRQFDIGIPLESHLGQPIGNYPDYYDLKNDVRSKLINARLCLSHSSGLPNWRWILDADTLRFHHNPGTRFEYSGEGYQLTQLAFEHVVKDSLHHYLQRTMFEPLSMRFSGMKWNGAWLANASCAHYADGNTYQYNRFKRPRAAGSMGTRAYDLGLWLQALMQNKGYYKGVLTEMMKPQIQIKSRRMLGPDRLIDDLTFAEYEISWGLGLGVFQSEHGPVGFQFGHDSGVQNLLLILPKKKMALVILTNADFFEDHAADFISACLGPLDVPFEWIYGGSN